VADCGTGKTLSIVAVAEYVCRRWEEQSAAGGLELLELGPQPITLIVAVHTLQQQAQMFDSLKPLFMGRRTGVFIVNGRSQCCPVPAVREAPVLQQVRMEGSKVSCTWVMLQCVTHYRSGVADSQM